MLFSPLICSTSSCSSQPSQPTAKSPVIPPRTVNSSAETRSSTWQNCQRGAQPFTVSSRGASKCLVTSVSTSVADQGGGPHHGHRHARVGPRRAARQLLDLQQVPGHAAVRVRGERHVLGQRDRVVGPGAVDHRAGHQHHAPDPPGRGRGEHGLRPAHVEGPARPGVGVGRQVVVGVHHDVDAGQPPGQGRVPHVGHPPGHARDVAAVAVDRDDLPDVRRRRQPDGQGAPDPVSRPGNRHDRHRLIPVCSLPALWSLRSWRTGRRAFVTVCFLRDNVTVMTLPSCRRANDG